MVAGHLQEKNGNYYMVLNYHGAAGKRKTKWFPTGLPVKGNKKKGSITKPVGFGVAIIASAAGIE